MAGQAYGVTFTVGLIDKLAGRSKPAPPPAQPQAQQQQQGPTRGILGLDPELIAIQRRDAQLAQALAKSRRVNQMLLKNEEEEVGKVQQLAAELLQQYSVPNRPVPCEQERQACITCYQQNIKDPLRCAPLVDHFEQCASKAFDARLRARS